MLSRDLNLLVALDILLEEESVTRAARRMEVSPPAMSRTLARIRDVFGDPILVSAGRKLVPTARAAALRPRVRAIVAEADTLLAHKELDLATLARTFVIRAADVIAACIGEPLVRQVNAAAPRVRVRFVPEGDATAPLRDGSVDLDIGIMDDLGPEICRQTLHTDRLVGVARRGHPLLTGPVTAPRYAEQLHVEVSRRNSARGLIDAALDDLGLARTLAIVVPGFYAALHIAAQSDLIAAVPGCWAQVAARAIPVVTFPLPLATPELDIAQAWHPRVDADPAHGWLREQVRLACVDRVLPSGGLESPPC